MGRNEVLGGRHGCTLKRRTTARIVAFDYLRTIGVMLVVLHHTMPAYSNFGSLSPYEPMATYSPVVDGAKSIISDLLIRLNDSFLVPPLFLPSGLFVWFGLQHTGIKQYLLTQLEQLGDSLPVRSLDHSGSLVSDHARNRPRVRRGKELWDTRAQKCS